MNYLDQHIGNEWNVKSYAQPKGTRWHVAPRRTSQSSNAREPTHGRRNADGASAQLGSQVGTTGAVDQSSRGACRQPLR